MNLIVSKEYKVWLAEIKQKVRAAQLKAAVKVNSELLLFYWELGAVLSPDRGAQNGVTIFCPG